MTTFPVLHVNLPGEPSNQLPIDDHPTVPENIGRWQQRDFRETDEKP
jgi:hypothetical protein